MNIERKPVAYGDMRGWIKALQDAGEIKEIDAEVDWNIEIGTVMRLAQGTGDGPALLFNNIKDYGANARCRRIFGCGLASYRRVAMMLGVSPDTHPRDLVKLGRNVLNGGIPPKIVSTGPVQGEHRHRRRCRPLRAAVAMVEQARRRPLSPDLWRLRHQGSRHRRDECRHLSRHGGEQERNPDPDVARPACRPARHLLGARRP